MSRTSTTIPSRTTTAISTRQTPARTTTTRPSRTQQKVDHVRLKIPTPKKKPTLAPTLTITTTDFNLTRILQDPNYTIEYDTNGQIKEIYKLATANTYIDKDGTILERKTYKREQIIFVDGKPRKYYTRKTATRTTSSGKKYKKIWNEFEVKYDKQGQKISARKNYAKGHKIKKDWVKTYKKGVLHKTSSGHKEKLAKQRTVEKETIKEKINLGTAGTVTLSTQKSGKEIIGTIEYKGRKYAMRKDGQLPTALKEALTKSTKKQTTTTQKSTPQNVIEAIKTGEEIGTRTNTRKNIGIPTLTPKPILHKQKTESLLERFKPTTFKRRLKERTKEVGGKGQFIKRLAKETGRTFISPFIGALKQNFKVSEGKPLIDIGQKKALKIKNKDRDIEAAKFAGAFVAGSLIAPTIATIAGGGVLASQTAEAIKDPTPEKLSVPISILAYGGAAKAGRLAKGIYEGDLSGTKIPKKYRNEYKALIRSEKGFKETSRNIQNINLKRVDSLKGQPKARKVINNFLNKNDVILGGTTAIETGGVKLNRKPQDLDLYTSGWKINKLTRKILNQLEQTSPKRYKISGKGKIKDIKTGNKVIEIHSKRNLLYPTLKTVTKFPKPTAAYIYKTPTGAKVVDPNLLTMRKFRGAFDDNLYRYTKDMPAGIKSAKQWLIEESAKAKTSRLPIYKQYKQFKTSYARQSLKPLEHLGTKERATPKPYRKIKRPSFKRALKDVDFKLFDKKGSLTPRKIRKGTKPYYTIKPYKTIFRVPSYYTNKTGERVYTTSYIPKYTTEITNNYIPENKYETSYKYIPESKIKYLTTNEKKYLTTNQKESKIKQIIQELTTKGKTQQKTNKKSKKKRKKISAWQPIYYDFQGNAVTGRKYVTWKDSLKGATTITDKTSWNRFNLIPTTAEKGEAIKGFKNAPIHKFRQRGRTTFIEKRNFRFDNAKEREGNFNIFDVVKI